MATYLYVGSRPTQDVPADQHIQFGIFRYDGATGALTRVGALSGDINSGNVQIDAERGLLYATDEVGSNPTGGRASGGRVLVYSIDPETGMLTELQSALSYGDHPSYIAIDPSKKFMITTHFCPPMAAVTKIVRNADGSYRVMPTVGDTTSVLRRVNADGTLGEVTDVIYHALPDESKPFNNAHIHSVVPAPSGDIYAACDMGLDKIYLYKIDAETGRLVIAGGAPHDGPVPGAGTRYCAFHPTKPWLFVNCEHKPLIHVFEYTADGGLTPICTADCFPGEGPVKGRNASDMKLSPDGRFVYDTMRASNTVSVFAVDQQTGMLSLIQTYQMQGDKPRSCEFTPDGKYLIVANTNSNLVEVIAVGQDGKLSPTTLSVSEICPGTLNFYTV